MPDDILDVAQGDVHTAEFLREVLESLAKHGSDTMREMAQEVLGGGATLREVAASGLYGDEVGATFSTFWTKYQKMASADRSQLEETGRHYLDRKTDVE